MSLASKSKESRIAKDLAGDTRLTARANKLLRDVHKAEPSLAPHVKSRILEIENSAPEQITKARPFDPSEKIPYDKKMAVERTLDILEAMQIRSPFSAAAMADSIRDVLVGNGIKDYGYSILETVAMSLEQPGVAAVVAKAFGRISLSFSFRSSKESSALMFLVMLKEHSNHTDLVLSIARAIDDSALTTHDNPNMIVAAASLLFSFRSDPVALEFAARFVSGLLNGKDSAELLSGPVPAGVARDLQRFIDFKAESEKKPERHRFSPYVALRDEIR